MHYCYVYANANTVPMLTAAALVLCNPVIGESGESAERMYCEISLAVVSLSACIRYVIMLFEKLYMCVSVPVPHATSAVNRR